MNKREFNSKFHFTRLKVPLNFVCLIWEYLGAVLSSAATLYVSKNDNNNNPGTLDEPWLTISHAAAFVGPGESLCVRV